MISEKDYIGGGTPIQRPARVDTTEKELTVNSKEESIKNNTSKFAEVKSYKTKAKKAFNLENFGFTKDVLVLFIILVIINIDPVKDNIISYLPEFLKRYKLSSVVTISALACLIFILSKKFILNEE